MKKSTATKPTTAKKKTTSKPTTTLPYPKDKVWHKKDGKVYLNHSQGVKKVVSKKTGTLIGYYGHSHRGGSTFKIGDKLFDAKWTGGKTESQLEKIAFQNRGSKTINNEADCIQAARNLSNYLS